MNTYDTSITHVTFTRRCPVWSPVDARRKEHLIQRTTPTKFEKMSSTAPPVANEDVTKRLSFGEISQQLNAKLQVDASEVDRVIAEGKDAPEAFVKCVDFVVWSSVLSARCVAIRLSGLIAHGEVNWRCRALEVLVEQCAQRQGAIQGNAKEQVRVFPVVSWFRGFVVS